MIMNLRRISAILLTFVIVLSFAGCADDGSRISKPQYISKIQTTESVVAENSTYSISFEPELGAIIVENKLDNSVYSSITDDSMGEDFANQQILKSSVVVDYMKQLDINYSSLFSADKSSCSQSCEKIENGLKVTYCFDEFQISVPVEYSLRNDGISASVNLNDIAEGSEYKVGRIAILPMFARVENNNPEGYLFIPSGSGGISYTKGEITKTSTMEVYGKDLSEVQSLLWTGENVCMPVFGAKKETTATMGIIDKGAEMATLLSSVNDVKMGSSYIYPTFKVRGYNKVSKNTGQTVESFIYNEDIADGNIKVDYYFLKNENADYFGMAEQYKKHLEEKYGKKETADNSSIYSIKFLGGAEEKKFFFGIPYDSFYTLTTIKDAKDICEELSNETGIYPLVQLSGYGKSGLENKYIAGGYSIASQLGKISDIADWQKKNTVAIDFDIVNFSKTSNGFSVRSDAARTTTDDLIELNYYQVALLSPNKALKGYYALSRKNLSKAAQKLSDFLEKKDINTLSLSTLGISAYSDYGDRKYFARCGMEEQVVNILSSFKDKALISNASFEYVAAHSDYIMDAPIQTSKSKIIDEEIPFYQIVFSCRSNVYNTSVNLATEDRIAFLKAVESGTGLEYTINKNYSTKLLGSSQNMLYATYYKGVKNRIVENVKEYEKFYDKIKDSYITGHHILENGLRKITYNNSVVVYVNYDSVPLFDGEVLVEANSYIVKEG